MNFFDQGFKAVQQWLDSDEGKSPTPPDWMTNEQRVEWWRGADKAKEFADTAAAQEEADMVQIEDAAIALLYSVLILAGLWAAASSIPWFSVAGAALALYSAYKLRNPTK